MKKLGLLALVASLGALVPASAAEAWRISVRPSTYYDWTKIVVPCSSDFSGRVVIRRNGRVVFSHRMSACGERSYHWACKRAGWHRWVARSGGQTRRGRFKVPECPSDPLNPFISKRRARKAIRQIVYEDAREEGYAVRNLSISDCRYGRSGTWNRRRWLCDLQLEASEGYGRRSYCGWGKVVKIGRRAVPSFSASPYSC